MQISEDFVIRFSDKANPNALIEKWPNYSDYAKEIAKYHYKSGPLHTGWPEDIESFLVFLKLLPAKSGKKTNSGTILPFSQATDKFIMHSNVSFKFVVFFIFQISFANFVLNEFVSMDLDTITMCFDDVNETLIPIGPSLGWPDALASNEFLMAFVTNFTLG